MRIRIVDAFSDRPFAGNPAAVCVLDPGGWPDAAWMQRVAAEMNLSETAFALPRDDGWGLRWFTPLVEVELCGHATLATAHALREDGLADGPIRFHGDACGLLLAHADGAGAITLDFPAATLAPTPPPDGLAEALGATPTAVLATGALGDLLVRLADEPALRALAPDLGAIAALTERERLRGVIATAPSTDGSVDYASRFFAPAVGIPEDPVTGSAHTALAPYWSAELGRATLQALQASPRGGRLTTSVAGDRVRLAGHAVTVLDGTLRA